MPCTLFQKYSPCAEAAKHSGKRLEYKLAAVEAYCSASCTFDLQTWPGLMQLTMQLISGRWLLWMYKLLYKAEVTVCYLPPLHLVAVFKRWHRLMPSHCFEGGQQCLTAKSLHKECL